MIVLKINKFDVVGGCVVGLQPNLRTYLVNRLNKSNKQ